MCHSRHLFLRLITPRLTFAQLASPNFKLFDSPSGWYCLDAGLGEPDSSPLLTLSKDGALRDEPLGLGEIGAKIPDIVSASI